MQKLIYSLFFILFTYSIANGQEKLYQPIERDTTFEPYVRFDQQSGNYYFGYVKDRETDKVYEAVYSPPIKISPIISVTTSVQNGLYHYQYSLKTGSESEQDIMSFELEIKGQFQDINFPSPWYYRESRALPFIRVVHKRLRRSVRREHDLIKVESDLSVGDSLEFDLNSKYLPAIVESYIKGRPAVINFSFVVPPPPQIELLRDSITTKVANRRGVMLKTIGPRKLPDNISSRTLLDSLYSYLFFSCDTSWISNQGICRSLQAKLEHVERQLNRGNANAASGSLKAFINEVEAQKGEQLSPEAYALLYYNGQYLLRQLNP